MTYFSPAYRNYMASPAWQAKRQKKLAQVGNRCESCGTYRTRGVYLQAHHLTYKRLGHEWMRDLKILCEGPNSKHCHQKAHDRKKRIRAVKKFIFGS